MKTRRFVVVCALLFTASLIAGAVAPPMFGTDSMVYSSRDWSDKATVVISDVPYAKGMSNKFDLYLPSSSRPVNKLIVYLHAGGFTGGDKADDATIAKALSAKGYVVATINYSLANGTHPVDVIDMSQEIRQGVDAVVAFAAEKGYPSDAMAIGGGSAGGALALIYAYRDGAAAPVPVKFVFSLVGPASFDPVHWFAIGDKFASDETARAGASFVSVMTGQSVSVEQMRSGKYLDVLQPITASAHVTPASPPTLLAYGALDKVAPYAASKGLIEKLRQERVPHEAIIFPNSGHGLNRDKDLALQLRIALDRSFLTYLPL